MTKEYSIRQLRKLYFNVQTRAQAVHELLVKMKSITLLLPKENALHAIAHNLYCQDLAYVDIDTDNPDEEAHLYDENLIQAKESIAEAGITEITIDGTVYYSVHPVFNPDLEFRKDWNLYSFPASHVHSLDDLLVPSLCPDSELPANLNVVELDFLKAGYVLAILKLMNTLRNFATVMHYLEQGFVQVSTTSKGIWFWNDKAFSAADLSRIASDMASLCDMRFAGIPPADKYFSSNGKNKLTRLPDNLLKE